MHGQLAQHLRSSYPKAKGHPRTPRGTWGNFEETRGGVGKAEKVACWSTKVAMSLKRLNIEKTLLLMAYRNSPTLFRTLTSLTPYGRLFSKIGGSPFASPIQKSNRSKEWMKLRTSNFAISHDSSEQKPIKHLGERGALAYPGTAQFFWVPSYISGIGKATNFKFCRHFYSINRKKSPLKFREK